MYSHTTYAPKITPTQLGEAVVTTHGVTQGRSSSSSYYSFFVSDMADNLHHLTQNEYLDPYCLAQLADDTSMFAGGKVIKVFNYSDNNFQVINIDKSKYVPLSVKPYVERIAINEDKVVESVDKNGYRYLGMIVINSNRITDHI